MEPPGIYQNSGRARIESGRAIRRLILLTPIAPAPTANGLAMRSELFRRSAAYDFDVRTIVVPVAGELARGVPLAPGAFVVHPDPSSARSGVIALLADRAWRRRLARLGTIPARASAASPGNADAVVRALSGVGPVAVHVMRLYLAPLGMAVAERLGAEWATLDLDEDDAVLAAVFGDAEEAAAYERLLRVFGALFDGLAAASAPEAAAIGGRHSLVVQVVPNAVDIPAQTARVRGRRISLLFVGNLTYLPNVEAVCLLVHAVLPAVRRRLGDGIGVTLIGPCDARVKRLAGPGVEVAGFVSNLGPRYASADVVVVPLRIGGGTRIKILEAFAHGVPVVASQAAAAGLEVADGRHLLVADDPEKVAAAIERIVTDAPLAERLVVEASQLVRERYSTDAVVPGVRELFRQASGRGRSRR
jgi:glycosyltransferase involved in cell wall biosynthesis